MDFDKMEISILEIKDTISEEYCWDFKIPPKSKISRSRDAASVAGGFIFKSLKFTRGILADAIHELIFAIYSNQINAYVRLPPKHSSKRIYINRAGKLELFSQNQLKGVKELKFEQDDLSSSSNPHFLYTTYWINTDNTWDDSIDLMRLSFHVEREDEGTVIIHANEFNGLKQLQLKQKELPPLELNAADLFLSNELSDVVFICENLEFYAHRFILACKSKVFKQMFQCKMKESTEGKIIIEDMEPKVLKEMLRFLYCGHVNDLKEVANDLFAAAEKYDLDGLKTLCESSLWVSTNADNALSMYVLADSYGGKMLKERALHLLKKYKSEVVQDVEAFLDFTKRYPDLMYELYKL